MNPLQLLSGVDVPIIEVGAAVHQPTIRDISYMGELEYFSAMQLLCIDKNTIIASNPTGASNLVNMNNFEIFMALLNEKGGAEKKEQIISALTILFPGYTVQFLPRGLFFNNATTKSSFTVDENNFDAIRTVLNEVSGLHNATGGQNGSFNPKGEMAAKIAAKLMRGRQRAAQQRGEGSASSGILARYVSILTVGLNSMSLNDCLNLTIYQLYDLIERYGLWISWDLDIKSRLAGGKPDSKPDDWMKNIH